ncbi:TM2 domain-containing protein [Rubrolithibacter danxiaensis]|uniref:TM2 domain-containing protein n=1 Tax=Rubrolithibacter danxiaensis TaxID=3390805 RepID=UPI003BF8AA21
MYQNPFINLKGMTPQEYQYLQQATQGLNNEQLQHFVMFYSGKRRDPSEILLFTILGFIIIAGVQRFMINQIGMGLLYLFTGGLCFIGTIVDAINHKTLAFEYNQKAAFESVQMVKMMFPDKGESSTE